MAGGDRCSGLVSTSTASAKSGASLPIPDARGAAQEAEASAGLLRAAAPLLGEVQAALPTLCTAARQAAAALVAFAALPAVRPSLALHCPPVSPAEQVLPLGSAIWPWPASAQRAGWARNRAYVGALLGAREAGCCCRGPRDCG